MEFKHAIEVVLRLTEEEAMWLHSVMQNPLKGQSRQEEDVEERHMRRKFFEATTLPRSH